MVQLSRVQGTKSIGELGMGENTNEFLCVDHWGSGSKFRKFLNNFMDTSWKQSQDHEVSMKRMHWQIARVL